MTSGNRAHEPLRRPGLARPVDPEDLQSLLEYRDARARAEANLGRPKQRDYDDRRRTSVPESDEAPTPAAPANSNPELRDSSPPEQRRQAAGSPSDRPTLARPQRADESRGVSAGAVGRADQGVDTREPELVELVEAGRRSTEKDPGKDRVSNRVRPPREGDTNYVVEDPADRSNTITDIDLVMGGTLWEIKKTTGQHPQMKPDQWAAAEVPRKLDKYVEARRHLEGYESAPIGLLFVQTGTTEHLRRSVDSAIAAWRENNPGESVKVRWAP